MERERFEIMYLMLLDKLIQFCEIHQDYAAGLIYAAEILRHDQAYERAHRQMMRLYYLIGDRTQALRQYKRCAVALRNELDIKPSEETKQLYEKIRLDTFNPLLATNERILSTQPLTETLQRLISFSDELSQMQVKVQKEIMNIRHALPLDLVTTGRSAQQALPPDAALRPQDCRVFEAWKRSDAFPIYDSGAGEAQGVGQFLV